jgi:hypothetical protein
MEQKPGFLIGDIPCPSCNKPHDLFVIDEAQLEGNYRFTCPHTGNVATWLCDQAAHFVQERPDGAIHAVPEE